MQVTFFIFHFSSAQSLVGAWVGTRMDIDSGFVCSLPLYLQVRADSTYTLSLVDNAAAAPRSTWSVNAGGVRLDTALFLPTQVRLTATELHITGASPMQFRRVQPGKSVVTEAGVRALLTNRIWQQGQVRYHFHEGGQACVEDVPGTDRAIRCWAVAERDGAVFIVIKGNRVDCSRNYDSPMQVMSQSDKLLIINDLSSVGPVANLVAGGSLPRGKTCASVGFQLCSNCFYPPYNQAMELDKKGPAGRYYAIRQRLRTEFTPGNVPGQTGIVQVRCRVNCEGQAGQFAATCLGPDYQRTQFDTTLTNQLLTILKTNFATGWVPGRLRKLPRQLDYESIINIRLVDGRITDVFP